MIQTLILQAHLDELSLADVPVVVGVELAEHFLGSLHGQTRNIKITAPQQRLDSFLRTFRQDLQIGKIPRMFVPNLRASTT